MTLTVLTFVWKANKKSSATLNTYGMCKYVKLADAFRINKNIVFVIRYLEKF